MWPRRRRSGGGTRTAGARNSGTEGRGLNSTKGGEKRGRGPQYKKKKKKKKRKNNENRKIGIRREACNDRDSCTRDLERTCYLSASNFLHRKPVSSKIKSPEKRSKANVVFRSLFASFLTSLAAILFRFYSFEFELGYDPIAQSTVDELVTFYRTIRFTWCVYIG